MEHPPTNTFPLFVSNIYSALLHYFDVSRAIKGTLPRTEPNDTPHTWKERTGTWTLTSTLRALCRNRIHLGNTSAKSGKLCQISGGGPILFMKCRSCYLCPACSQPHWFSSIKSSGDEKSGVIGVWLLSRWGDEGMVLKCRYLCKRETVFVGDKLPNTASPFLVPSRLFN